MRSTDVAPWEPASFPTPQRFHAFAHLRDLPSPQRSTLRALNEHRVRCLHKPEVTAVNGRWKAWSVEDDWVGRLLAYDGHLDAVHREQVIAEQKQVAERHRRALNAAVNTVLIPTKALLARYGSPGFEQELASLSGVGLLREALRANVALPGLIAAEREAHGLVSPLEIVVDDQRLERERAWSDRALANPKVVDLLSDVLTEMANDDASDTPTH